MFGFIASSTKRANPAGHTYRSSFRETEAPQQLAITVRLLKWVSHAVSIAACHQGSASAPQMWQHTPDQFPPGSKNSTDSLNFAVTASACGVRAASSFRALSAACGDGRYCGSVGMNLSQLSDISNLGGPNQGFGRSQPTHGPARRPQSEMT